MIIETKDDVVQLSGSLTKNQWMTIKAAANLLLHSHPQGIIIDCGDLDNISDEGAKTFLDAMRDIEAAKTRIVVANLPPNLLAVCRTVPGVRSQLPIATSVEEARASLRMGSKLQPTTQPADASRRGSVILVPLIGEADLTYGASLAGRISRVSRGEVRLVYFLEVPRNLPLSTPMLEGEKPAMEALERALQYARQQGVQPIEHVERVRDATEGILAAVKAYNVDLLVLGAASEPVADEGHERFHVLVDALLHRAPCEVIIGRLKLNT